MHISPWDFLSTDIVERIGHVFGRDAVSALGFDMEGVLEDFEFFSGQKDNSEHCISPVWGCHHLGREAHLNVTNRLWCYVKCQAL